MMRRVSIFARTIVALALFFACAACARADAPFVPTDKIIPISEIKPGMKGTCVTVVSGQKRETFPVEVIDVISSTSSPKNLIVIRASGPLIKKTGGIAAGMSGSPMYINGRLAGAIGYGWEFTDHDIGLVTSIEDMLCVWNAPERVPSFAPAPIIPDEPPTSGDAQPGASDIMLDDETEQETEPDDAVSQDVIEVAGYGKFKALVPPVYVGGVSPRAAKKIGDALGAHVIPFSGGPIGGEKRAKYGASLQPGDAIGASLVWGDVEIAAIGTLSAVAKDGRFIAFAHPFVGNGTTSAALTEAHISTVIPSVANSFKLGTTGDMVGIITQDRPEGIGGRIGTFAPAAGCTINVKDIDAGVSHTRRFQMVNDPFLISELASAAATGCIEDLWARTGGGSARVVTTFYGGALMSGWSRTNVFVSPTDVIADMTEEFSTLVEIFSLNQFQELRPFGVKVDVELTADPRVVYIEDVKVPEGPFAPGSTVSFDITLRAWRQAPITRSYELTVPQNVSGICELMVRGGGIAEEEAEYTAARWRSISSMPILLKELDARESNDQLVLEIRGQEAMEDLIRRAQTGSPDELMNDKLKSELREEKETEGSMKVIRTNYYVEGMVQKLIRVEKGNDAEAPEDPAQEEAEEEAEQEQGQE